MLLHVALPLVALVMAPISSADSEAYPNGGFSILQLAAKAPAGESKQAGRVPPDPKTLHWNGLTELKREYTDKGTPPEKTQSTLKIDWFPRGILSLLRLQLVFPDENQADATPFNFFHPRMGDLKTRAGFRSFPVFGRRLATFVEFTFPTADPASLGQRKYQLNTGARVAIPMGGSRAFALRTDVQVSETFSYAGDPTAKGINKSNVELTTRGTWRSGSYVQISLKPVVDWSNSADTGAIAELKGSWNISPRWVVWGMYGHLAWNASAPGLYQHKLGFGIIRQIGRLRIPIAADE